MASSSKPPSDLETGQTTLLGNPPTPTPHSAHIRIKRSLDRCLELYHRSPVGYLVVDEDTRILHANATMGTMLAVTLSELLFNQLSNYIYPTDRQRFTSRYLALYQDPVGKEIEIRFQRKDGSFFIGQLTGSHIRSELSSPQAIHQPPPQLLISVVDVTIRSRAERMILSAKRQWEQTFDAVPDLIAIIDENQVIRRINQPFAQRLSRPPEACVGQKCHDVIYRKPACPPDCPHFQSRQSGVPVRGDRYIQHLNGHFSIFAAPFTPEDLSEKWGIVVYSDISERKLAERELLRSRTLESIGCLAGGIAHDYNNLLTSLMGYIELAKVNRADEAVAATYLDHASDTLGHVRELTSRLLTFSSGGLPHRKPADLQKIVENIAPLGLSGSNVKLEVSTEGELLPASVDALQIKIALRNILINAREAMPQGGDLRIRLRQVRAPASPSEDRRLGDFNEIQIADEGCGIPASEVDKVFDPYYTTKARGTDRGMGLGLAIAYSIFQQHEGHIKIQSVPGKGTTVTIHLPAVTNDASTTAPAPRFLIMDDETELWGYLEQVFLGKECEVDFAANGVEALRLYLNALSGGRPYTGLLLDLTIDGGDGGVSVLREIHELDPDARAVAISGDTAAAVLKDPAGHGFLDALAKPFRIDDLHSLIDRLASQNTPAYQ